MRTKTLLLAAAALAAGIVSSEAQSNVYSQNIVGYAQVVMPNGAYVAVNNPFNVDGVNNSTNVLANLPNGSVLEVWNGSGFSSATKASFGPNAGLWNTNFTLAPGVGFFVNCNGTYTNTFIGSLVVNVGASNTLAIASGVNAFIGSPVPFSGNLNDAGGTNVLNLGTTLADGSVVQVWNGAGYTASTRQSFGPNAGIWTSNLTINVGEGFFINANGNTNWLQTVPE
jgi:hypothetical protein